MVMLKKRVPSKAPIPELPKPQPVAHKMLKKRPPAPQTPTKEVIVRPTTSGIEQLALMKINKRQRQIIVHSVIYYRMNTNLVDDTTWGKWARELVELQKEYPEVTKMSVFYEDMKDFDASTGFHLADHSWGISKATQLIDYYRRLDNS